MRLGATTAESFQVKNTGTSNLVLSGGTLVSVSDSQFVVTTDPASPALPGASTKFTPGTLGLHTATVTLRGSRMCSRWRARVWVRRWPYWVTAW